MTEKRKRGTRNPLKFLWNELLFTRYFTYETDLSFDEATERLANLNFTHPASGLLTVVYMDDSQLSTNNLITFDIELIRAGAKGTITTDHLTGQTVISGQVQMALRFFAFIVGAAAFLFFLGLIIIRNSDDSLLNFEGFWLASCIGFVIITVISMYKARNRLTEDITEALFPDTVPQISGLSAIRAKLRNRRVKRDDRKTEA